MLLFATFLLSVNAFFEFQPDDLVTFDIESQSTERFIENITNPTQIKGAYQVNQAREGIDFSVRNPKGRTIHSRMNMTSENFNVNASDIGLYEIVFNNRRKNKLTITYAVDVHQGVSDQVTSKDIDPVEQDLQQIQSNLMEVYYEHKFQQLKYDTQSEAIKEANKRIFVFTVVETIVIVAVTIW